MPLKTMNSDTSNLQASIHDNDYLVKMMAKWPNVPEVYGWLKINRKGNWLIKEQPISHLRIKDFLNRNYFSDSNGNWFVQNGPQRVYVELEYTPHVFRIRDYSFIYTTTGKEVHQVKSFLLDEQGNILIFSELGLGLIYDKDLSRVVESLSDTTLNKLFINWKSFNYFLINCHSKEMPKIFRFNPLPDNKSNGNY